MAAGYTRTQGTLAARRGFPTDASIFEDLLGTPFVWGGRDATGLDCWGLSILVYRRLGIEIIDPLRYTKDPRCGDLFTAYQGDEWKDIEGEPALWDVLLFSKRGYHAAMHAGIYVHERKVLQAIEKVGVATIRLQRQRQSLFGIRRHQCLA